MAHAKMACAKVSLRQVGFAPKWLAPSRPRQVGRAKLAAPNSPIPAILTIENPTKTSKLELKLFDSDSVLRADGTAS